MAPNIRSEVGSFITDIVKNPKINKFEEWSNHALILYHLMAL